MLIVTYDLNAVILTFTTLLILQPMRLDLIPKMTAPFQGIRFRTVNDVLQATDRSLRNLQRLGTLSGIQLLPLRWERVLHNGGDYSEGL